MPPADVHFVMNPPGIGSAQSPEVMSSPSSHAGSMSSPAASCAVRRIATSSSSKPAFPALFAARSGCADRARADGASTTSAVLVTIRGPSAAAAAPASSPATTAIPCRRPGVRRCRAADLGVGGTGPLAAPVFWAHFRFGPRPQACSPDGDRTAGLAMLLQVALVVLLSPVKRRRRSDLRDDLPSHRLLRGVA